MTRAAVVDPWGGGALLAPAFRRRGWKRIAVHSGPETASRLGAETRAPLKSGHTTAARKTRIARTATMTKIPPVVITTEVRRSISRTRRLVARRRTRGRAGAAARAVGELIMLERRDLSVRCARGAVCGAGAVLGAKVVTSRALTHLLFSAPASSA